MAIDDPFNKVLLVNPAGKIYVHPDGTIGERKHCTPHLGLAYLAGGLLARGYDVEVLDILAEGYENEVYREPFIIYGLDPVETMNRIRQAKPDVVGISILFSNRAGEAYALAEAIKQSLPNVKVVVGGQHPSGAPLEAMKRDAIDFVLSGEADLTFGHLMDALNGRLGMESVRGLHYRCDGQVIDTMRGVKPALEGLGWKYYSRKDAAIPEKLDELPFPAWHLLPMHAYWSSAVRVGGGDIIRERFAVMMSTRGCPHTCTFCTSPLLSGYKAYRRRDNETVVKEIRWLVDSFGVQEVQFLDDNFFVSAPRVKQLCRLLAKEFPDIVFSVPSGTEVNALDAEMIALLAEANFHKITLAVEAGDPEIQAKLIDKHVKLDRLPWVIDEIHKHGMTVHALFMVGFPNEKPEQIKRTVDMALSLDVDDFYISIATPLPGTPFYDECLKGSLFVEGFNPESLRYSHASIKLPEATERSIEGVRRQAWVQMKQRGRRQTGSMKKNAYKTYTDVTSYDSAGFVLDPKALRTKTPGRVS